jgi:broad specificity phosphatase PhoE
MTLRLLLVRHGETDANAAGRSQGHRDVPLNERGRVQSRALATWLLDEPLAAVYSSDSSRSLDTARVIAEPHGLEVAVDPRLRELDQGELDGLTGPEMREQHPEFLRAWRGDDPGDLRIPGGETLHELQQRMVEAVEEMAHTHPDATVVAVSHNLATRVLLCHALHVPLASFRRIRHEVASLAEVEVRLEDWWTVVRMNEQCHLIEGMPAYQPNWVEHHRSTHEPGAAGSTPA